jgi:3-hydroxymyristoyl/3-hydroxydecanoyl-(acyl carrier protein) dehydratase
MGTTITVLVPPQHPAFEGHFPGAPLLPGVVLLDEALRVVEEARFGDGAAAAGTSGAAAGVGSDAGRTGAATGWTIATAKFLQPVRPGDTLTVEHEALANGAVRFAIRSGGRAVATGTLVPRLEVTERDNGHQAS